MSCISFEDNHLLSVRVDEISLSVGTFRTKKAAISAGKEYGWPCAIKLNRRFEDVWVVGKKDFQNDDQTGLEFEVFRFPILKWENVGGVQTCRVLKVRKYKAA